jgi:hypothetical protein
MDNFAEDKADKLERIWPLRIINALGMLAWHKDSYGCADQKLRRLHPLSWVWFLIMILAALFMAGVPETVKAVKRSFRDDTVWW